MLYYCRHLLSSSLTLNVCHVTHQGAARGGPVVLRLVRVTLWYTGHIDVCSFAVQTWRLEYCS